MSIAIHSDDPKAIEKLQAKLGQCEKDQAFMKSVNAYYRKNGTTKGCEGVSPELAAKLDQRATEPFYKAPFATYQLANNNAEIGRLKKRIEQLSADRATGFNGWEFDGGKAVANEGNNRLQILFNEKPGEEQRAVLKANGFHWAPSEKAWQRQLNHNAISAADRIDFIKPLDGRRPSELQPEQPKQPKKTEPER